MSLENGWVPSSATPLMFGPLVSCGLPGDEISGTVQMPLYADAVLHMNFVVPSAQTSIQVAVCLANNGATAPVQLQLLSSSNAVLATATIPASEVMTAASWTAFATLAPGSGIPAGDYTLQVSSPSSTSTAYYLAYFNIGGQDWIEPNLSRASYTPPTGSGYSGNSGYSTLWVKDSSSNDLLILPFGIAGDTSLVGTTMSFTAQSSSQVNCLALWLSDMEFLLPNPSVTFTLTDTTTGSSISGTATQYYNSHGLQGLIVIQLSSVINIVSGHTYQISISGQYANYYTILIRGSKINPPLSGVSAYWLGGLALGDFSQVRVLDYGGNTQTLQNGHGGIGGTDMVAARIVPNFTETITSVKLRTSTGLNSPPVPGNYPSGIPVTVSLYASNENAGAPEFAQPTGSPIASASIDSGQVPLSGFFEIPTNFAVTKGTPYWLVWSAPSGGTSFINLMRCVSPWRNLALAYTTNWTFFGQGPTDLAFAAISSSEILGSPYDNTIEAVVTPSQFVAQPFQLTQGGTVSSVFVYLFRAGGVLTAEIYPDNGSGTGPNMSAGNLGSGSFDTNTFLYFYSGAIIPISNGVPLSANTKYWIVFSSDSQSYLSVASYWTRPVDPSVPAGFEALSGSGTTWTPLSSEVATVVFMVGLEIGSKMNIVDILENHGINTKSFIAYNDPLSGQPAPFASMLDAMQYYYSQGFRIYALVDCSNPLSYYIDTITAALQAGIICLAPTYPYGYETQFYWNTNGYMNLPNPNEQEYYLSGFTTQGGNVPTTKPPIYGPYSLVPALAFNTYPGLVIDAPEVLAGFKNFYSQLDSAIGLKNLIGVSDALNSDHPINYMGAQGQMGGNNMNTFVRFVNSPTGLYLNGYQGYGAVNSSGNHVSDGTQCLLYSLIGQSPNYTGSAIIPPVNMAVDMYQYHHYNTAASNAVIDSPFGQYGAAATCALESGIMDYFLSINPYAFLRTAIPVGALNAYLPNWDTKYVTEQMTSSVSAAIAFMQDYPNQVMLPYFNYSNFDDNSSNAALGGQDVACPPCGQNTVNPGYGIADPTTVSNFFSQWVTALADYVPFMEVDTAACAMQSQSTATSWGVQGPQYASIPIIPPPPPPPPPSTKSVILSIRVTVE